MSEVLWGLIGVVVGFLMELVATQWREHQTEKAEINSTRTMLALEVEQNLERLHDLWGAIEKAIPRYSGTGSLEEAEWAYALLSIPWPGWDRRAWDELTGRIPRALKSEKIRQVHPFTDSWTHST